MATRRTVGKRQPRKVVISQLASETDDLALAEELIRAAREEQAAVAAESRKFRKFLRQLGIRGRPVGAKKLREMAIREGLDPEGTDFSRGIIEMREE